MAIFLFVSLWLQAEEISSAAGMAKEARLEERLLRCTLMVDGRERSFYVYRPSFRDRKSTLPLVVLFHGGPGNADGHETAGRTRTALPWWAGKCSSGTERAMNSGEKQKKRAFFSLRLTGPEDWRINFLPGM